MKKIIFASLVFAFLFIPEQGHAKDFNTWLLNLKQEALGQGISQKTLDTSLKNVKPITRVVELDRKQPEGRLTFPEYKTRVINNKRIQIGRTMLHKHKDILNKVSQEYGVPASVIVALWGIETSYGENTGGFGVIPALATLAYDGRRADFFRSELLKALKILDEGHITEEKMKGSWAGAMGQNQFMPSSYFAYAVDYDRDGHKDIWNNLPDIFASIANYLHKSGWKAGESWGKEIIMTRQVPENILGRDVKKTLPAWQNLGVTLPSRQSLPTAPSTQASLIVPEGMPDNQGFLAYENYNVIMKWNRSIYFATSVGLLADAIQ